METRQRLETWPVFDAEFGATSGTSTPEPSEPIPIPVSVKRRREPAPKFHVGGQIWPRQS